MKNYRIVEYTEQESMESEDFPSGFLPGTQEVTKKGYFHRWFYGVRLEEEKRQLLALIEDASGELLFRYPREITFTTQESNPLDDKFNKAPRYGDNML